MHLTDVIDESECLLHGESDIFENCINKVWPYSRISRTLSEVSVTTLFSFSYSIRGSPFSLENLAYASHLPFLKYNMVVDHLI